MSSAVARSICVAALGLVVLGLFPPEERGVAAPLVLAIVIALTFTSVLFARSATAPIAELGLWFVAAVTVYTVLPLGVYLLLGQQYTPLNDGRLFALQATPAQVSGAAWLYVAFLAPFCLAYLAVRREAKLQQPIVALPARHLVGVMVGVWIGFTALTWMVSLGAQTTGDYASGYAAYNALPLGVRQAIKLWQGWSILLTLAIRVSLFSDFSRYRWIIASWVAYDVMVTLSVLGSRTYLILSLASCFLLYHLMVRPIRVRTAVVMASTGLFGFLALGVLRTFQGLGTAVQFAPGSSGGEFEALFANVVDLRQRLTTGERLAIPFEMHFADLAAMFPSQLVPFEKFDPGVWYVTTFFPSAAEQGFAFAFGVVAQGVLGLGWIELVLRGAAVGVGFAVVHRYLCRQSHRFWVVVFYVWLTMWAYQSFRNQSFILIGYIVQQFVPLVLLVEGFRLVLIGASRPVSPSTANPSVD